MSTVNKVILVGNLGKDPEVRHLDNGSKVANFSLATTESYRNREGQKVQQTEWHNIVVWRGLADITERYLTKGSKVYIEGRIKTRSWEDKDSIKRYTTEIIADTLTMLGSRKDDTPMDVADSHLHSDDAPTGAERTPLSGEPKGTTENSNDLPF